MVNIHHYPDALIEAIRKTKNFSGLIHLEKGSSECLYVITFEEDEKKIFNVVTYGNVTIKKYLLNFYAKPRKEMSYIEENAQKKLILFIKKIFSDYKLKTILIDGEELTLDTMLYKIVKYNDKLNEAEDKALYDFIKESLEEISKKLGKL